MNILITGGAGYIGPHIAKACVEEGHHVTTLDSLERGHRELVKWGAFVQASLEDEAAVMRALRDAQPEVVIHCAGYIDVEESTRLPALYQQKNVENTATLLRCMHACGVSKLMFSSTGSVYAASEHPLSEEAPCAPLNPYSTSKLACEALIQESGLRAVMFRYFNAAGADASGEIGEWHEPETHVIPRLLSHQGTFTINGTNYPTADGTAVRDYIHVSDIAQAHIKTLAHLKTHQGAHIFNLGTGKGTSLRALVAAYARVIGRALEVVEGPARAGDAASLVANPAKANQMLDWTAKHSSIEHILTSAAKWHETIHRHSLLQ